MPTFAELATFWSEAENADIRRIIANSKDLPSVSVKKQNHRQTLVDKLLQLDEDFFGLFHEFALDTDTKIAPKKLSPRPHQQQMIDAVINGFETNDRGKLIAACGTGKTLAGMWATESESLDANNVLILVPSIALVGQTLNEWVMNRSKKFDYLCVCSDTSVTGNVSDFDEAESEQEDVLVSDLGVTVTTDSELISSWIKSSGKRKYIFSTYHSIEAIETALNSLEEFKFDLVVFDEAHRTTGASDQLFAAALTDSKIPAKKRLFMTATERLINPRIKSFAQNAGKEVFSMDDEDTYGPTFFAYKFGDAINDGVIADYEIILSEVTADRENELIQLNRLLQVESNEGNEQVQVSADQLYKAGLLYKAIANGETAKAISFHNAKKSASNFALCLEYLANTKKLANQPYITTIFGDNNSSERAERIDNFKNAESGLIANVQVLSEGVDIPLIDTVYFVDPKSSVVDIVQAVGRALRKPQGLETKVAKIIIPFRVPAGITSLDEVDWDSTLQTFHEVLQAMRSQDQRLADEVNQINLFGATGGKSGRRIDNSKGTKIKVNITDPALALPESISIDDFLSRITLRVATANEQGVNTGFSHLGKGQRRSEFKPILTFFGDYTIDIFRDALIMPTVKQFKSSNDVLKREQLQITHNGVLSHNNISSAKRMGVIKFVDKNSASLSEIGQRLHSKELNFNDVFANQLMLFEANGIFPYRELIKVLSIVHSINHIEFLYGPYAMQLNAMGQPDTNGAVARIQAIRANFENIDIVNTHNREDVLAKLNDITGFDMSFEDVWSDRTTIKNKYRYFKNHLSALPIIKNPEGGYREPLELQDENEQLEDFLKMSNPNSAPNAEFYGNWIWINS
jgi:superfamily II DNA or RNA helicase